MSPLSDENITDHLDRWDESLLNISPPTPPIRSIQDYDGNKYLKRPLNKGGLNIFRFKLISEPSEGFQIGVRRVDMLEGEYLILSEW
jgi:hypothetical protein